VIEENDDPDGHGVGPEFPGPAWSVRNEALRDAYSRIREREDIRFLFGAKLTGCQGSIGSFRLCLETRDEVIEETVGAVVLATETEAVPLFESYGLSEAGNAETLSRLENMLDPKTGDKEAALSLTRGDQIALLSGFAREGDPLSQRRILNCLHDLDEMGYRTYVYTRNLKVADDGLEELAKEDRQLGTVFFKLEEWPKISADGRQISHLDPVLECEVQLEPKLIVLEEELLPATANQRLARTLNIASGEDGFLQEENIHRLPVHTNRRGIFAVGSARDIMTPEQIRNDAAHAAIALKDDFQALQNSLFGSRTFIDEDKCCACLTCYRLCPHGAITVEDKPVISMLDCQACGLCASQCPQGAISIPDIPWQETKQSVAESLREGKETARSPRIIAYCCRNSAYDAGMAAQAFNRDLPSGLEIVEIPCAGSINHDLILSSLNEGADGLLILGCHFGACKSSQGNTYAQHASSRLGSILEEVGLSQERVRFRTLADNMDLEFARYTREMEENLHRLGRNPLA